MPTETRSVRQIMRLVNMTVQIHETLVNYTW